MTTFPDDSLNVATWERLQECERRLAAAEAVVEAARARLRYDGFRGRINSPWDAVEHLRCREAEIAALATYDALDFTKDMT